jgi:hypothetical protein
MVSLQDSSSPRFVKIFCVLISPVEVPIEAIQGGRPAEKYLFRSRSNRGLVAAQGMRNRIVALSSGAYRQNRLPNPANCPPPDFGG